MVLMKVEAVISVLADLLNVLPGNAIPCKFYAPDVGCVIRVVEEKELLK